MAESIRTCIGCGEKKQKIALQRFVWRDEQPVYDPSGHASGRGAYCCLNEVCLHKFTNQKKKWKRIFRL
ncbi:MAG: YlxR family protein [Desulfobulbaceae bacterium]|nr:MAG: YlxR family protein [Desulfobulbaceae bacterium]